VDADRLVSDPSPGVDALHGVGAVELSDFGAEPGRARALTEAFEPFGAIARLLQELAPGGLCGVLPTHLWVVARQAGG